MGGRGVIFQSDLSFKIILLRKYIKLMEKKLMAYSINQSGLFRQKMSIV